MILHSGVLNNYFANRKLTAMEGILSINIIVCVCVRERERERAM